VLRIEIVLGLIASALAILAFMARAYANIRRGQRAKRLSKELGIRADAELERLREDLEAAERMSARPEDLDSDEHP
jgi:hypothetical protein